MDNEGNLITADKATYDKIKGIIVADGNVELTLKEGYFLTSNKVLYNNIRKVINYQR